jgi:glycerol-3-phosphate acyltransferase PlsX
MLPNSTSGQERQLESKVRRRIPAIERESEIFNKFSIVFLKTGRFIKVLQERFLMENRKIALEATGADGGYEEAKKGTAEAIRKRQGLEVFVVAGKDKLKEQGYLTDREELADEAIPEGTDRDHVILTERTFYYPDKTSHNSSSIYKALDMHKSGEVEAVIAPGDTYPTVTKAFELFGRNERIGKVRPAIAVDFSGNVLIDAGANRECKPKNYYQFAIMGSVISRHMLGIKDPLIGIVTIGSEEWKGDSVAQNSLPLLKKLKDHGYNVSEEFFEPYNLKDPDGKGFRSGLVLVTNAIVGNTILKMGETSFGISGDLTRLAYSEEPWWSRALGAVPLRRIGRRLKRYVDPRVFGAAPLYGFDANVMIAHGCSDAEAIENSILRTADYLAYNLNDRLREEFDRIS